MANAFGIIASSGTHIKVEGLLDYRPIAAFSSTSTPGMRTLSMIFAPLPTFAPVKRTEFFTSPSTIQPCVINARLILASGPMY